MYSQSLLAVAPLLSLGAASPLSFNSLLHLRQDTPSVGPFHLMALTGGDVSILAAPVNGSIAAELHSTDDGTTQILLRNPAQDGQNSLPVPSSTASVSVQDQPPSTGTYTYGYPTATGYYPVKSTITTSTNLPTKPILPRATGSAAATDLTVVGSLNTQDGKTTFMVSSPLRSGGSEPDFVVVGAVDAASGMAPLEVQPAGYGEGFYARQGEGEQQGKQFLGYKGEQGEAKFYACVNATMPQPQLVAGFGDKADQQGCQTVDLQMVIESQ